MRFHLQELYLLLETSFQSFDGVCGDISKDLIISCTLLLEYCFLIDKIQNGLSLYLYKVFLFLLLFSTEFLLFLLSKTI